MRKVVQEHGLFVAWAVALTAMLGSLYFSEIRDYIPCTHCWYQRILMYPLAIVLGIAAVRKDTGIVKYALPLSGAGVLLASYHYMLQKTDWFAGSSGACGVECTMQYLNLYGFITIPFLSLTAFLIISVILAAVWRTSPKA